MSLFQCEECGCRENTAVSCQGFKSMAHLFSWRGIEHRKGKMLCCVCGPTEYKNGKRTKYGVWHGRFPRMFLPKGEFHTNNQGNLTHTKTGNSFYTLFDLCRKGEDHEE